MQKGGGVACVFKKSITVLPLTINTDNKFYDILAFDIKTKNGLIRFCVVYFPPNHSENDEKNLKIDLDEISDIIHDIFVIGDFNKPNINWDNPDIHSSHLSQFCIENGMTQAINEPTRGENILDLLFCTNITLLNKCEVQEPFANSDHNSIHFEIFKEKFETENAKIRNFYNADYDNIYLGLSNISWPDTFSICANIEDFWHVFSSVLENLINRYVPFRTNKNLHSEKHTPLDLRKLLRKKRRLWKKLKGTENPQTRTNYNTCLRNIKKFLYASRCDEENKILERIKSKSFFKFVNSHLNLKESVPVLSDNGKILASDIEKADILNKYFVSVFTPDDNILPYFQTQIKSELKNCIFTSETVRKALKCLKPCFSSGPDNFPSFFIKKLSNYICVPLATIFEVSFRTHKLPTAWLQSNIVPIHKKGSKNDVKNYRPISLTCVCCRVMESILKKHIQQYLTENQYLSKNQYGFRTHHSTCSQLLHCTNIWTQQIDKGKSVDVIYFDFAKAFDTVCHSKLLSKLTAYGIKGDIFEWIKAFLNDRKQKVVINQHFSTEKKVISGVPQGSVLGPLLFLIYINDLPRILPQNVHCAMFADDLKLFAEISNENDKLNLQNSIDMIQNWSETWQLSLASNKCSVLHLGRKNLNHTYTINGVNLNTDTFVRDLGVKMSSDGKFTKHIKTIVTSAHLRLSQIFKIFRSNNPELLLKAYKTYVRPILDYCSPVWSPFYLKDISLIEKVQKRITRKILGKTKSYTDRLTELNLKSLEERRIKADLIECFKYLNFEFYPKNIFQKSKNKYNRNNDLYIEYAKLDMRKFWFANRTSKFWNSLPGDVKNATSLISFSSKLEISNLRTLCRGPDL